MRFDQFFRLPFFVKAQQGKRLRVVDQLSNYDLALVLGYAFEMLGGGALVGLSFHQLFGAAFCILASFIHRASDPLKYDGAPLEEALGYRGEREFRSAQIAQNVTDHFIYFGDEKVSASVRNVPISSRRS